MDRNINNVIHFAASAGIASLRNPMDKLSNRECPSVTGSSAGRNGKPDLVTAKAVKAPQNAARNSICQGSGFCLSIISIYRLKNTAGITAAIKRIIVVGSMFFKLRISLVA